MKILLTIFAMILSLLTLGLLGWMLYQTSITDPKYFVQLTKQVFEFVGGMIATAVFIFALVLWAKFWSD